MAVGLLLVVACNSTTKKTNINETAITVSTTTEMVSRKVALDSLRAYIILNVGFRWWI